MNHIQFKKMIRSLFFSKEQRPYLVAIVIATVLALYWDLHAPAPLTTTVEADSPESADTLIPSGFVLVPIEVQNFESLDSILGKFGIVDLYQPARRPGSKPFRVASRIKIMRAPLNPSHFAVLVPEEESASLVSSTLPFTVVVQRSSDDKNDVGTKIENQIDEPSKLSGLKKSPPNTRLRASRITVEVQNAESVADRITD